MKMDILLHLKGLERMLNKMYRATLRMTMMRMRMKMKKTQKMLKGPVSRLW